MHLGGQLSDLLKLALRILGALAFVGACSSPSGRAGVAPSDDGGLSASVDAANSPTPDVLSPPACQAGGACGCANGTNGVTKCTDSGATCSCPVCPVLSPPATSAWQPCGGSPFGRWRTKSDDITAYALDLYDNAQFKETTCPEQLVKELTPVDLRLELENGGGAVLSVTGGKGSFRVAADCAHATGCASLGCTAEVCGATCACDASVIATNAISGTWTRSMTALGITSADGKSVYAFDYCVDGSMMTLRDSFGNFITLEPAYVAGTPAACEGRSADQCALSTGCELGACVGTADCQSAASEGDCTNRQGCTWSPQTCTGMAPATCSLGDYDLVPGCNFVNGTAQCVGTPAPCAGRGNCGTAPGCGAAACLGGTFDCSEIGILEPPIGYSPDTLCAGAAGCTSYGLDRCGGTGSCATISPLNCAGYVNQACSLGCAGTPTPCEQLDELSCETDPGCQVVIDPLSDAGTSD
jgi:hypothetical protein